VSFRSLLIFTATITREIADGFDDYGNTVRDYETIAEDVPCRLVEAGGPENIEDRDTVTRSAMLYFLPSVEVTALDRVEINDETWEVFGAPVPRFNSLTLHHVEVPVRLVTL